MNCPYCSSPSTKNLRKKTRLGYQAFRCATCGRVFNERTGTPFNYLEYPTDIVLLVIFWRLRYKLSLRDLVEIFRERGFTFTHEAIRDWEARFATMVQERLRIKQRKQTAWTVTETPIQAHGKSYYLYRAVDRAGNLIDVMLSEKQNLTAARRFFTLAGVVAGYPPGRLTSDEQDF